MWCSDLFNELLPLCSGCQSPFDMRCCAPQVLPCSHTLCLACVTSDSKNRKSGKRRCMTCDKRYTSFHLNTALGETIERIRVRREALESQSRRCDECEKRAYLSWMRRCITCEFQLKETHLTSVICLECCVDRHNGHALRVVTSDPYVNKDDKIGHSISVCGSTTSSNQYRSNSQSSMNSPRIQSNTRLHSTSSASSGFSSGGNVSSPGGNNSVDTRNGISQKMSSFFSRVTTRSPTLPHQSPIQRKVSIMPPPFQQNEEGRKRSVTSHQPPPPNVTLPMVPSPSRGGTISSFRPPMDYMTPNTRGVSSLKKSLDDLDDCMPKGDILREEMSPFYEGHSMYGMSLLVGVSPPTRSSPSPSPIPLLSIHPPSRPVSEVKMDEKRSSVSLSHGEYHRLSPYPLRRSPIPYSKTSIGSGGTVKVKSPLANLANMPRRDPRIRGGPAYLIDVDGAGHYYENGYRLSFNSSGSSSIGGYRTTPERREEERQERQERPIERTLPSAAATFFDKHILNDKRGSGSAAPSTNSTHSHYINVTRSCENLPSQFSALGVNKHDGREGMRRGFPFRRSLFNNLSDHCYSYEYIGSEKGNY